VTVCLKGVLSLHLPNQRDKKVYQLDFLSFEGICSSHAQVKLQNKLDETWSWSKSGKHHLSADFIERLFRKHNALLSKKTFSVYPKRSKMPSLLIFSRFKYKRKFTSLVTKIWDAIGTSITNTTN